MTDQHRATPEQWAHIERNSSDLAGYSAVRELRDRIAALEAAQASTPPAPAQSLVERVATIITHATTSRGAAEDAIREVAAWIRSNPGPNSAWSAVARDLMDEVQP